MGTCVLVHGGWHGGWCWNKVEPRLSAAGHRVYTPTLTGLGERVHLAAPEVGLGTHIEDVTNLLVYEDLGDVVLVGHSYTGMVIRGVAEHVPERLAHLVYLDAFVPEDGKAMFDLLPPDRRQQFEAQAHAEGDGWRIPAWAPGPWEPILRNAWHITDEADLRWMLARLTPQPLKTFTESLRCSSQAAEHIAHTYIRCTSSTPSPFDRWGSLAQRPGSGWNYRELATWHDAMMTMPGELSEILLDVLASIHPT